MYIYKQLFKKTILKHNLLFYVLYKILQYIIQFTYNHFKFKKIILQLSKRKYRKNVIINEVLTIK